MPRLLKATRYLILVPILGLAVAAALFFVLGGIGLLALGLNVFLSWAGFTQMQTSHEVLIVQVVEFVHSFLVGTVLYITALGLYQLFIQPIEFHGWLRIESTEDLENNLVGVTVVVLAVNFMGAIFGQGTANLLQYGAGIALPIAALGFFVGMRAWASTRIKQAR